MASELLKALKDINNPLNKRPVGSLNNWNKKYLNQGAYAFQEMENWTLVKLDFENEKRIAIPLDADDEKGWLVATPEDYVGEWETISSFYNAKDEMVRVIKLDKGVRFETSNFDLEDINIEANPIKSGQKVHYDAAGGMFKISNLTPDGVPEYANAANQFVVVEANPQLLDGQPLVRFEVVK
jgi:hypothetical protein